MNWFATLSLVLSSLATRAQGIDNLKSKTLDPTAMQADFTYLKNLLQETHPGLYRYTPKETMLAKMDSSEALLEKPMPFYDFYKIIEALIADIHCAHTSSLPVKNIESYFNGKMKTLPFFLLPLQDKEYVLFNCTDDDSILPGFELLSINGRSIADIRNTINRYYWSDGFIEPANNVAFKGQLFDILYYALIDRPDRFQLSFRTLKGDTIAYSTAAETFGNYSKNISRNTVNKQMNEWYNKNKPGHPWRLTFLEDTPATAVLRFDSFGGEGANTDEEARNVFRTFMDKSLAEIEKHKSGNLVIDVRSNSGGWDIQGVELFTYLMKSDSALKYYQRKYAITENSRFLKFSDLSAENLRKVKDELTPEPDSTFTLKEDKNPILQLQIPKPNRFKGQVYILLNGATFSTAAEFTAAAHFNKLGIFVGDESAGSYDGGNGGNFIHLELPNSRIAISTPLIYYQMNVGDTKRKGRGTIPDYTIPSTLNDMMTHTDSQLEFVKKLIIGK
jgi:hypothetical protein